MLISRQGFGCKSSMNYDVAFDWRKLISFTHLQNILWHRMRYWWKTFERGEKWRNSNAASCELIKTSFSSLFRKYQLRKVMINGDIPRKVKKDAHAVILEFIRSRPPLRKVSCTETFFFIIRLMNKHRVIFASVTYQFLIVFLFHRQLIENWHLWNVIHHHVSSFSTQLGKGECSNRLHKDWKIDVSLN